MAQLSILIPARNEQFLSRTIEDILSNIRGDTEIIATLDGEWASPPIKDDPRVTLIYHPESVGQRAGTNDAAKLSKAKYLMKVDAHCAFDEGFDVKMMAEMHDDWTMVPIMRNLHAFDWVCTSETCDWKTYQGPTPGGKVGEPVCPKCGSPARRNMVWAAKKSPQSVSYCFDSEPHFQYFKEFSKRPEGKGDITPTMSLQGSCFMLTRDKYWELNVCDEAFGSWGSQGIEVAARTWLSGGSVMVNHKTWYAHLFRTQGGDFGFPYPLSGNQVDRAKKRARDIFLGNKWEKQVRPLSWLLEKFWPVPGWDDAALAKLKASEARFQAQGVTITEPIEEAPAAPSKGIVYYTDNRLDQEIAAACQKQLEKCSVPIVSVSLKPLGFGHNIVIEAERSPLTMFKQILAGLEASTADIIFFAEHDVLYSPEHFDFTPPDRTKIYYNLNAWLLRSTDGHALYYKAKRTSQLCAYRDVLIEHYRKRVAMVEEHGFSRKMGYEPASHGRSERVDDLKSDTWASSVPNIDIKHGNNLTEARWSKDKFRDQQNCQDWKEADEIPGWGVTKGRFKDLLESV
jgi:glycosyltransferase involved in cell wall biosynthesis